VCQREQAAGPGEQVNTAISAGKVICSQAKQLYEQLYGVEGTFRRAASTAIRQELS